VGGSVLQRRKVCCKFWLIPPHGLCRRAKMAAVYERLGGENNKFREEKYIPLREITLEMGEASQRVHHFLADEAYAASVVEACDEVEAMMLAPMRDLLHDRSQCFHKVGTAAKLVVFDERLVG